MLVGLALAVTANAQPPATPSTDAAKVSLLVTVRDKHGKIVGNLSPNDFVVEENGRPQVIRDFGRAGELPLTLGFVVDTALTERQFLEQRNSATGKFIDQLLREDKDKAFLIQFNREVELLQDLTPSRQALTTAFGSLEKPSLNRPADSSRSGGDDYPGGRGGYPGRRAGGAVLYDAIYLSGTELMQKQAGRKVIIVFSDGVDRGSKVTLARAIEAAQRADTIVYTILVPSPQEGSQSPSRHDRGGLGGPIGPRGPLGYPFPRSPEPYPQPPRQNRGEGKDTLQRVSKPTGGRVFELSKKQTLEQIYQQIQEELRNQYNLGYTSDGLGAASEYRKIDVNTKKNDLLVQARDGYYPARQPDSKKETKQN
jgi:VWFA-related protein